MVNDNMCSFARSLEEWKFRKDCGRERRPA